MTAITLLVFRTGELKRLLVLCSGCSNEHVRPSSGTRCPSLWLWLPVVPYIVRATAKPLTRNKVLVNKSEFTIQEAIVCQVRGNTLYTCIYTIQKDRAR